MDIEQIARECGFDLERDFQGEPNYWWCPPSALNLFASRIRQEAIKEAADIADSHCVEDGNLDCQGCGEYIASAIRAAAKGVR